MLVFYVRRQINDYLFIYLSISLRVSYSPISLVIFFQSYLIQGRLLALSYFGSSSIPISLIEPSHLGSSSSSISFSGFSQPYLIQGLLTQDLHNFPISFRIFFLPSNSFRIAIQPYLIQARIVSLSHLGWTSSLISIRIFFQPNLT